MSPSSQGSRSQNAGSRIDEIKTQVLEAFGVLDGKKKEHFEKAANANSEEEL